MRPKTVAPSAADTVTVAVVLGAAALAAWARLIASPMPGGGARAAMGGMSGGMGPATFATMWLAMVAAMMLPTVVPMAAAAWAVLGRYGPRSRVFRWTAFTGAYFALWAGAGGAALAIWELARGHAVAAGALIVVAGLYQLGWLKQACLRTCRAPVAFFLRHGQQLGSLRGAAALGARHGLVCLGCCAGLMVALAGAGVVDVAWMGALALLMLLEKIHPRGRFLGLASGAALLAAAPFASHLTMTGGQARASGLVALALVALTALALIARGRKFRVAGPAHQEGK